MAWDFLLYLLYLFLLLLYLFLLLRILLLLQKFPVHSDLQLKGEPPGTGIRPGFISIQLTCGLIFIERTGYTRRPRPTSRNYNRIFW